MNKQLLGLLAALVALAAVVAGCGSSSDTTESTEPESTASISKAQFLKQGNAICEEGNKEIEEGFEEFTKEEGISENHPPSEEQSKQASETILIPAIRRDIDGIRALGTPEGDEGELEKLLGNVESALEEGEEDPVAMIEEEDQGAFKQANKEAREYGLTVCGEEEGGEAEEG